MSPTHLGFLKQLIEVIHEDLNLLQKMSHKKQMEYVQVRAMILELEGDLDHMGVKTIINTDPLDDIGATAENEVNGNLKEQSNDNKNYFV